MPTSISQVTQTFLNGNLASANPDVKYNKRTYLIGVAAKGPVGIPVQITNIEQIESIFGSYGVSPLSIKLRETWLTTADTVGVRQIFGVRLGGGQYATLEIPETTFTSPNYRRSDADYSIRLTAKYPGNLLVTIKTDIVDGQNAVVIYNPDTDIESIFPYDFTDLDNLEVDVHTVSELVNAINNDPNLNSIITADYPTLRAYYELDLHDSGTYSVGYSTTNNFPVITLTDRTADTGATEIFGTEDLYTGYTKNAPISAENLVQTVNRLYEVSVIKEQLIDGTGYREFLLTKDPIVYPMAHVSTKLIDLDATVDTGITVVPEYKQSLRQALMGVVTDTSVYTYTIPLYLAPDLYSVTIEDEWTTAKAKADSSYSGIDSSWTWSYVSSATDTNHDKIIVYFKHGNSIMPIVRSNYTVTWDYDATDGPTLSVAIDAAYMATYIQAGDSILIDVDTVKGKMYETTTLQSLQARPYFYYYFASGRKLYTGAPLPSSIRISYSVVRDYTVGENVLVSDKALGEFTFTDTTYTVGSIGDPEVITRYGGSGLGLQDVHPIVENFSSTIPQCLYMDAGVADPTYRLIHRDGNNGTAFNTSIAISYIRVGFDYTYEPEWPYITSVPYTMQGGTSGINVDNNTKYDELNSVFTMLEPYQPDIVALVGLYFDDVKRSSNPITGVPEDINAGFHTLLKNYILSQSSESRPCVGLISVKNPTSYSQEAVTNWIDKLVRVDSKEPTRAANVKYDFVTTTPYPEFIGICTLPVIKQINGVTYSTTGEANVAGQLSALPSNEALNAKRLEAIVGVPYGFTRTQSKLLAGSNYVTFQYMEPYGYVIANDPTVRGYDTDYNTLSVVFSIFETVTAVRDVLQPFLGKKYTEVVRNAMQTQVDKAIREKKIDGSIVNGIGIINATTVMQRLGMVECSLTIRPAFGIREITIPVKASLTI